MILDQGPCAVYGKTNTAPAGAMPTYSYAEIFRSFYGRLAFETAPARPTDGREEVETDLRIRILQNTQIKNLDRVALTLEPGADKYEIRRAYHGTDDESGEMITDLTLRRISP